MAVRGREVGLQLEHCTPHPDAPPHPRPGSSQCRPPPAHTGLGPGRGLQLLGHVHVLPAPICGTGQEEELPHQQGAGHAEGEKAGHPTKGNRATKGVGVRPH